MKARFHDLRYTAITTYSKAERLIQVSWQLPVIVRAGCWNTTPCPDGGERNGREAIVDGKRRFQQRDTQRETGDEKW